MVTAIVPGTATTTIMGPNGTMTTITVTVGSVPTGGLMRQVNRRKTLKRQMYGRAGFDLLRIRVLAPA